MANTFNHNDKVVITDGGSVGIGKTSSILAPLNVFNSSSTTIAVFENNASSIELKLGDSSNTSYTNMVFYSSSGNAQIWKSAGDTSYGGAKSLNIYNSNGAIAFHPNSTANAMFINTSGNVGIGTTSPSYKLHVADSTTSGRALFAYQTATSGTNYGAVLAAEGNGATKNVGLYATAQGATENYAALFDRGNVGIGTTTPIDVLHVHKSGANTRLVVGNNAAYDQFIYFQGNTDWSMGIDASNSNAFTLSNYSSIGTNTRLVVTTDGKVGIGTTTPSHFIHAKTVSTTWGYRFENNTSNEDVHVFLSHGGGYGIAVDSTENADDKYLLKLSGGTGAGTGIGSVARMIVTTSGNVGIGTTSPDRQLQVHESTSGTSTAKFTNSTTGEDGDTGFFVGINGSEQPILYGYNNTDMIVGTNGSERMRITSGGAVLVNKTSSTGDIFQVQGSNNVFAARLDGSTTGGQSYGLRVRAGTNSTDSGLLVENTSGTDLFIVRGDGNVGIGTTSPSVKLHIHSSAGDGLIRISGDNILNSGGTIKGFNNGLAFNVAPSGGGTEIEAVRINGSGNVGIGMTSPAAKLDVAGQIITSDSVRFTGNVSTPTGNSVFRPASNTLAFGTASAERMRIDASGNVGIGTTSPTQKLTVEDTIGIKRANVDAVATIQQTGAGTEINAPNGYHPLIIKHNGTEFARFKNDGNVGIGTTSPANKLHVVGSSSDTAGTGLLRIEGGGGGGNVSWTFRSTVTNNDLTLDRQYAGAYYQALTFQRSSGNVGIGTTSPNSKLEVVSAITFSSIDTFGQFVIKSATGATGDLLNFGVDSTNGLAFIQANDRGTATIPLSLQRYGGNVGIGTTSPSDRITVGGNIGVEYGGYLGFYRYSGATHTFTTDGFTSSMFGISSGVFTGRSNAGLVVSGYDQIRYYVDNAERMRIAPGGNVGIGTTSPGYKLDVSGGAIAIRGNAAGNSLRFDDNLGNSRNAMYVDTSNYLNIGNSNYAGLKLVHTATAPQANGLEGNQIAEGFGTTENGKVLAEPTAWLAVRVGTTDYAIPMYSVG